MRMRRVDPEGFDRFIKFNMAGFLDVDEDNSGPPLWVWNLASEGQTIETDIFWLPLLVNLRPELIVLFRGSLESIIRPAMLKDSSWPSWVPKGWRGCVAMDPRCYFSSTWWRRTKQTTVDRIKQSTRKRLLSRRPGVPLMDASTLITHYEELLKKLRPLESRILLLGLLSPDSNTFPGSPENFAYINGELSALAKRNGVEFLDWGRTLFSDHRSDELFYRDGFHPNPTGCGVLAEVLAEYLETDSKN